MSEILQQEYELKKKVALAEYVTKAIELQVELSRNGIEGFQAGFRAGYYCNQKDSKKV